MELEFSSFTGGAAYSGGSPPTTPSADSLLRTGGEEAPRGSTRICPTGVPKNGLQSVYPHWLPFGAWGWLSGRAGCRAFVFDVCHF